MSYLLRLRIWEDKYTVSVIVIFTDGYGLFPEESDILDIPILWLIDNEDVIPPFGRVARIRKAQQ